MTIILKEMLLVLQKRLLTVLTRHIFNTKIKNEPLNTFIVAQDNESY